MSMTVKDIRAALVTMPEDAVVALQCSDGNALALDSVMADHGVAAVYGAATDTPQPMFLRALATAYSDGDWVLTSRCQDIVVLKAAHSDGLDRT